MSRIMKKTFQAQKNYFDTSFHIFCYHPFGQSHSKEQTENHTSD